MLKRKKKIIAKVMATTMLASTLISTYSISADALESRATVNTTTIAGVNRYETAVKISENGWTTATNAVLINGENGLVDALTATPYANLKNAPILITHKDKLTPATKTRLTKMGVKNVDIVGGTSVVSEKVVEELKDMKITVNRISGINRYETATAVANAMDKISDVSKIAVVNGVTGLPDAVSIAAPAANNKMPILLVNPKSGLNPSAKDFIKDENISKSYVIGQTAAVSDSIKNSLPGTKVRLGGTTRQATNAEVIEEFYTSKSLNNIYVAKSGQVQKSDELVDALAVGALAAKKASPVMIVGKSLDSAQNTLLENKEFSNITVVGAGVPSASIDAIKATQNDPEAKVTSITMVDYKTIKIVGTELNRLNASNISISGNTVKSYSANTAGTEATVEFNNAFASGTNTVKINSNLGNTTTHTFTYSSEISSVQATTKEVAPSGIQHLEFTVNGDQKRSIDELKALGWDVEFKSSYNIFYDETNPAAGTTTSKSGKLTTNTTLPTEFIYEVILTKGTTILKSNKQVVSIKEENDQIKEIKSFDKDFIGTNLVFESDKLLVGESIKISNLKILKNNDREEILANGSDILGANVEITSSNPSILTVNGTTITAGTEGSATITIKAGSVSKELNITVLKASTNARTASSVKFYLENTQVSSVNMISENMDLKVKVKVIDQHGDPITTGFNIKQTIETAGTTSNPPVIVANVKNTTPTFNSKGEAQLEITSSDIDKIGNGVLRIQKDVNGTPKDISTLNVIVSKLSQNTTYTMSIPEGKDYILDKYYPKQDITKKDNELIVTINEKASNGYVIGAKDISDSKYTIEILNSNGTTNNTIVTAVKGSEKGTIKINTIENDVTGSVVIKVYETKTVNGTDVKTQIGSNINVTVKDSTPTISDIKINQLKDITKLNSDSSKYEFELENLFDITYIKIDDSATENDKDNEDKFKKVVSGIKLNGYSADEVLISINTTDKSKAEATLFIDEDGDDIFSAEDDLILGTVNIELSNIVGSDSLTDNSQINITESQKGKVGYIIARLYNGEYSSSKTPFDNVTIKVNIPKD